jgi:flavin reductase (DIM6/NTAB) family NADH-FMN oxidoreductase RutF
MDTQLPEGLMTLDVGPSLWSRFYTVSSLVVVGTKEESGAYDLAPKHMALPLGFAGHFGFVCTPRHHTYGNARREGAFTVSHPQPTQVVMASLATAPREGDDGCKPSLSVIPTFPATKVDGVLLEDGYLFFECELDRVIDGFGEHGLIVGRIVAAHARHSVLRDEEVDDQELIYEMPLLAYLHPGRYSPIERSYSFPFLEGFRG